MIKNILSIVYSAIFCGLLFPLGSSMAQEELKLWAGIAPRQAVLSKIKTPFEQKTGIRLDLGPNDSTASATDYFKSMLNGDVEAAVGGTSFEDWIKIMKREGIDGKILKEVKGRVIGRDNISVIGHKDNQMQKLGLDQLKSIFSGKVTSWKEVGGADVPVTVFLVKDKVATLESFKKNVLFELSFTENAKISGSWKDVMKSVSETPGGITFGIPSFDLTSPWPGTVVKIDTLPIRRPITLVYRKKPSQSLQALLDFIKTEGKAYGLNR